MSALGLAGLLTATLAAGAAWTPRARTADSNARTQPRARVAFFYRPPVDGTTAAFLASHVSLIILTHSDEAYMAKLRQSGFTGPILQYVTANQTEGPGPYVSAASACDDSYPPYARTIADLPGMFCEQIHPHESWFLHNREGERLWSRYRSGNGVWRTSYEMNPASEGWRQFMIRRLQAYRKLGYDGFFFDNVDLSRGGLLRLADADGGVKEFADDASFRRAVAGYLVALRAAFPHRPLWANLTHDPGTPGNWNAYTASLDGVMVEDFALGWTSYALDASGREVQFDNIRQTLAQGKGVIAVEQGSRHRNPANVARLRFGLASYWALAEGTATEDRSGRVPGGIYFRYGDAFDEDYRSFQWHQGYDFSPASEGQPLQVERQQWQRRFPAGDLRLNLVQATVSLPPGWRRAWKDLW